VFFTLKELGSGAVWCFLSVNSLDSLYAGAFLQLPTGRIGWSGLCTLIHPLMEGADGFMFVYFHLHSSGMRDVLSFIVCLIWFWNILVGSVVAVWKYLLCMKFCILVSYCCVGSTSMELPLSARVIMALFSLSLVWIDLMSLDSGCVLWLGLFCCNVTMWSATNFL